MRILSTESHLSEGNQFSRSIQLPNGINICDYLFRYINNSYFDFWGPCLVVWFLPFLPHSLSLFCVLGGKSLVRVKRKKLGQHPNTLKWYSEKSQRLQDVFLFHFEESILVAPSCATLSLLQHPVLDDLIGRSWGQGDGGTGEGRKLSDAHWGCFDLSHPKTDLETRPWAQAVYLKHNPRKHKWKHVESETRKGEGPVQAA